MTINTTIVESGPYAGNGAADTYAYNFKILHADQIVVVETDDSGVATTLVFGSGYSITGIGVNGGGNVVRTAGNLPNNYTWLISRDTNPVQNADFPNQGDFSPESHENAFDKAMMIAQENKSASSALTSLSVRAPVVDVAPSMQLPVAATRAGLFLRFANASGDVEVADVLPSGTALSQSVIAALLWPITDDEITAGATIVNFSYPQGNVLRYGTNTVPGTTDMTTAIQTAVDVAIVSNSNVFLPAGRYKITAAISINEIIQFRGEGDHSTIIEPSGAIYGIIINPTNVEPIWRGGLLEDFQVLGTSSGLAGLRLGHLSNYTRSISQLTCRRLKLEGFTSSSITHPNNTGETMTGGAGMVQLLSQTGLFERVYCVKNYHGAFIGEINSGPTTDVYQMCNFRENDKYGFWAWGMTAAHFNGCVFESNFDSGMYCGGGPAVLAVGLKDSTFIGSYFENNNRTLGTYAWIIDAPHVNVLASGMTIIGMRMSFPAGKSGLLFDKGRESIIIGPKTGNITAPMITTTNSTNVLIIGGDDDAMFTLDDNTVHQKFDPFPNRGGRFTTFNGQLKFKVGIGAARPRVDGTLHSDGQNANTTAVTTEEVLKTYTVPGNTLLNIGHGLKVTVAGVFAGNANAKTLRVKVDGNPVAINDVTTSPNGDRFEFHIMLIHHGGTDLNSFSRPIVGAINQTLAAVVSVIDMTADFDIEVTGQNGTASANDITVQQFHVQTINEHTD